MTKALTSTENSKKGKVTTQKRQQNFDYTTISDWLRMVSWNNDSHPTGKVKPVNGIQTFPLNQKDIHLKMLHTSTMFVYKSSKKLRENYN